MPLAEKEIKTEDIYMIPEVSRACTPIYGKSTAPSDALWLFSCLFVAVAESLVTKECMRSDMCNRVYSDGVRCCAEDLCNGGRHTGVFVPLLVASVAIFTLMI